MRAYLGGRRRGGTNQVHGVVAYLLLRAAVLLGTTVLAATAVLAGAGEAHAADPPRGKSTAREDYPYFFPILGAKAHARGFNVQRPWGLGVNYMFIHQQVKIETIGLSVNDNPTEDVSGLFGFKGVRSEGHIFTLRPDLWILPFLNVYGLFGAATMSTKVEVSQPLNFTSLVNQGASTTGFGATAAMSMFGLFLSADVNFTWNKLENIASPIPGRVISGRFGKNFFFPRGRSLTLWAGVMNQYVSTETTGTIKLSDALPADTINVITDAANNFCDNSARPLVCHKLVNQLGQKIPTDTTVNYSLKKKLKTPNNMIVGGQVGLSEAWYVRSEVGFIGRYSVLLSANYRWGMPIH